MPRSALLLALLLGASCATPTPSLPPQFNRNALQTAECRRDGQALVYNLAQAELRLERGELLWIDGGGGAVSEKCTRRKCRIRKVYTETAAGFRGGGAADS